MLRSGLVLHFKHIGLSAPTRCMARGGHFYPLSPAVLEVTETSEFEALSLRSFVPHL